MGHVQEIEDGGENTSFCCFILWRSCIWIALFHSAIIKIKIVFVVLYSLTPPAEHFQYWSNKSVHLGTNNVTVFNLELLTN